LGKCGKIKEEKLVLAGHIPYEENHRSINGYLEKKCNQHHIYFPDESPWMPCTLEYFYNNKSSSKDGLNTWCRRCAVIKGQIRQNSIDKKGYDHQRYIENPEYYANNHKRYYQDNKERERLRLKEFTINNPHRVRKYTKDHRNHDITKTEKCSLLKVFNNACAYCGMTEEENKCHKYRVQYIMERC
jgi:hypothetical protein